MLRSAAIARGLAWKRAFLHMFLGQEIEMEMSEDESDVADYSNSHDEFMMFSGSTGKLY